jgi:hypothetical protein
MASNNSVLFAKTNVSQKIVYLPPASTIPGRILYVKDLCCNSVPSSIYLSTAAGDMIDYRMNTLYAKLDIQATSLKLASNGSNNWMVLSHYIDAIGQPPPPPPPVPPPPPQTPWASNINGDGSVTDQGGGSWYIVGPNDGAGNGWSYIYSQFGSAGNFTYGYNWYTFDGIIYDWPFQYVTAADPSNPANVSFATKIATTNSESGTRNVSYSAGDYVVLGVYSVDSVAGPGYCTFSSLP